MQFAANISAVVQAWLEDVTGHPYPLPKMGETILIET